VNRLKNTLIVADVRDCLIPKSRLKQLSYYDRVIACSRSVECHLLQEPSLKGKIFEIPAIQEKLTPPQKIYSTKILKKHRIEGFEYWLYLGLIKQSKGIDRLIRIFSEALKTKPHIRLVLAGPMRDKNLVARESIAIAKSVIVLGSVPRDEARVLISQAALVVNCSPTESISRIALEAIDLGIPVGLPPNIKEYEQWAPAFIIHEALTPSDAAQRLITIAESHSVPPYPMDRHRSSSVVPQYLSLLKQEVA
jgi:glycosyltransferase involved in cell wall biosynthesis